jgi:acyl-CoA thioester hydrolase
MSLQYVANRRVEFRDTDAAGIMHFSAFFIYMEEAEHELLRSVGLSVLTRDDVGPISWPRVAVHCNFRSAVRFEDPLTIEVTVEKLGQKSVTYSFAFQCEGRQVATGTMTAVCCRLNPDGTIASIAIPADIRARLAGERM